MQRAVFFDFGGTLFSYRPLGPELFRVTLGAVERMGLRVDPGALARAYRSGSREAYRARAGHDYYLHRDVFCDSFARTLRALGHEAPPDLLDWFHERQRDAVVGGFELREDCLETLDALRRRDLHVAIVSNIDDDYLKPMVERFGLAERLHAWTSSEEARSCKPHAGIFALACQKAGVEPGSAVFVGDSAEADIAGARPLGMHTVHIVEDGAPAPGAEVGPAGEPHHEIRRLSELVGIVDAWAGA